MTARKTALLLILDGWGHREATDSNAISAAKGFCPAMKEHGATNLRMTVTGYKTLRTMTIWSSEEKLKANIDEVRAAAASVAGMTVTGGMMGALAVELD